MKYLALALVLVACGARAQAADLVVPQAEPVKLSSPTAPKDDLSNCAFITNDCEVCTVDANGKAFCSSQGIACVPTKRTCLIQKK